MGDQNEYAHYQGDGGVPVGGWLKRLLWAFRFKSMSILMNTDVHAESRIMLYRRVLDRLQRLAPFLLFDQDPYIVLSEGKAVLDLRRLHAHGLLPVFPAHGQLRQLHPQFGQSDRRRVRRDR